MSGFSSLNIGTRALFAAQRALDVTGQNVSNANTEGYSRQRVEQAALGASLVPAMFSRWDGVGGGVDVTGLTRVRDDFLEARAQQQHASNASMSTTQQVYADIETTFGEPSESALQKQMSDFWNAWDEVANDPAAPAPRSELLEQADGLAGSFNSVAGRLTQQWSDTREQLAATVADVNTMAADIAKLNSTIRASSVAGVPANELADQRDALVLALGDAIGATATKGDDGTVDVALGGSPLVLGDRARTLAVTGPAGYTGAPGTVGVVWDDGSGYPVTGLGGTTSARLAALDTVLPSYLSALDDVAASLATTVNAQQAAGFDLSATAGGPANGRPMFSGTTASTLTLVLRNPAGLAASSAAPPDANGDNALATAAHAADVGGAGAAYRQLVVTLGVQAQSVNRQADVQAAVTTQIDNARMSASGVSLDEEMTNLVMYQHAYEAAARFVNAIDSTLDTLINMTR